jgi:hypothetical protein
MANAHTLSWVNPTTNTDGSPFAQSDSAGYELAFDGTPAVSIPLTYGTSFDMSTLAAYEALSTGTHTVTLAIVNTGGNASAPSNAASFSIVATPNAPTQLAVN